MIWHDDKSTVKQHEPRYGEKKNQEKNNFNSAKRTSTIILKKGNIGHAKSSQIVNPFENMNK